MKSWWRILCVGAALLSAVRVGAYQDYPQAIGDLVYRDSDHQIYGRDGVSTSMAISHPGHVGVYVGSGQVAEALATTYCRREELGAMSFLAFIDRTASHF